MQQYFVKGSASSPVTIEDKETSKHMFQVMRLKEDDEVTLVFDDGIKHLARVLGVEARQLELVEELADNVELHIQVTIASGFPKGDKLEFITQKVTELGASQIWAFPADWSVAKWDGKKLGKKVEKLEKIALGAAEQSKRNWVPEVTLFEKKVDFLAQLDQFDRIVSARASAGQPAQGQDTARTTDGQDPAVRVLRSDRSDAGVRSATPVETISPNEQEAVLKFALAHESAASLPRPVPLVLGGFSFGTFVQSRLMQRLDGYPVEHRPMVFVGPAVSRFDVAEVPADTLVVHGEEDDVVPLASVLDWARPQQLPVVVVPGVGHFFHGRLPQLKTLILRHMAGTHV